MEKNLSNFCRSINQQVDIKILVHLAERWCGYNIIELSECSGQKTCGLKDCEMIIAEEEKAANKLIGDYLEQQDVREQIREKLKYKSIGGQGIRGALPVIHPPVP